MVGVKNQFDSFLQSKKISPSVLIPILLGAKFHFRRNFFWGGNLKVGDRNEFPVFEPPSIRIRMTNRTQNPVGLSFKQCSYLTLAPKKKWLPSFQLVLNKLNNRCSIGQRSSIPAAKTKELEASLSLLWHISCRQSKLPSV